MEPISQVITVLLIASFILLLLYCLPTRPKTVMKSAASRTDDFYFQSMGMAHECMNCETNWISPSENCPQCINARPKEACSLD